MHLNDGAGLTNHANPNQTAQKLSKLSLHCVRRPIPPNIYNFYGIYSRTSVTGTLMARLLQLFQTRSRLLFTVIFFSILKMVHGAYSLESPRPGHFYENTKHTSYKEIEKISLLCLLTWHFD